jgi:hypothetical protein
MLAVLQSCCCQYAAAQRLYQCIQQLAYAIAHAALQQVCELMLCHGVLTTWQLLALAVLNNSNISASLRMT